MDISTPALLFPAIAILMLGFINRYVAAAGVIRAFKKDYDTGYVHNDIVDQLKILRKRISLLRYTLLVGVIALLFACLSMFFIFVGTSDSGAIVFGVSIGAMILALLISLYETSLSNVSLNMEIDDVLAKEAKKSK